MKHRYSFILPVLLIIAAAACSKGNQTGQSSTPETPEFLSYKGDFHNDVIAPQVKAWKEVAEVMYPRVSDDIVTEWNAQYADSLANVLLSDKNIPVGEQLTRLYEIESVICYGMSYSSAMSWIAFNPKQGRAALKIKQTTFHIADSLKSVNYNDPLLLTLFEQSVFYNFRDFIMLGTQYAAGEPQFVHKLIEVDAINYKRISSLFQSMGNNIQAYRYCTYINNTCFYMTLCSLALWHGDDNFKLANQEKYMKIAGWFDEKAAPVISALQNDSINQLTPISDNDYSLFLKQSSDYRAQLIKLFAEAILTIKL